MRSGVDVVAGWRPAGAGCGSGAITVRVLHGHGLVAVHRVPTGPGVDGDRTSVAGPIIVEWLAGSMSAFAGARAPEPNQKRNKREQPNAHNTTHTHTQDDHPLSHSRLEHRRQDPRRWYEDHLTSSSFNFR
jgi:hypothetical protein